MKKIIFVTGTDTGVGKTLLTALMLFHLRRKGIHALAMKPFCSGGRADIQRLQALQPGELSDGEMNPFYFAQPLAPYVAAGRQLNQICLENALGKINKTAKKCEQLLVEGSGGVLVPLGERLTVADLIAGLDCKVIVTARNRLGSINHTLLTVQALQRVGIAEADVAVCLMSMLKPDLSAKTNPKVIAKLLDKVKVLSLPYLGGNAISKASIHLNYSKVCTTLAKLAF
jgi:dethiobiotin synthetase